MMRVSGRLRDDPRDVEDEHIEDVAFVESTELLRERLLGFS